jgi:hypothetical protein
MAALTERRREGLFLSVLLAGLVALQCVHITRPFLRHHESLGTEVGKHARNHLKFGLSQTAGLKLDVSGPSLEPYANPRHYFYANHPPLPVLLMAASFAVFGSGEVQYRVTLIVCSIAALVLFRLFARRVLPAPYDRAATAIFAFLPAFAYYSIVTCLQVTTLVAVLGALNFYVRWRESGRPAHYAGIVASIGVATLCSWSGYYVAPALVAAHLRKGERGNRAVLALLAFNVLFFGLYLFWLWRAEPVDLDPIRKLLGAGLNRSSWSGLSFLGYVVGETRKLSLVLTAPALLVAGFWVASLFRLAPDRNDRLIASLALLGLDQVVFVRLAMGHEYYNYFLCVFVALAAAAGLSRLARRPALRTFAVAAGVLILLQSAWILQRRLTKEGGYEFYYKLGIALDGATRPSDRVLLLTDNLPFYTPYYGDRYAVYYDRTAGELLPENSGGRRSGVSESDLLDLIRTNSDGFDVAVTAEKASVVPHVRWLQGRDEAGLHAFGVETGRTARRELLEQVCGPPREAGGFLFWDFRRR